MVLTFALLGSACRQDDPVTTLPTPTQTPSVSPSPSLLEDFVLEGQVVEAWAAFGGDVVGGESSASSNSNSLRASPAAAGDDAAAGGSASPGVSPAAAEDAASGTVTVKLTSYFSESGCAFDVDDVVVIRFTPRTTVEPAELGDDSDFPANLENAKVTISGNLLNPGADCLPVADSITLLEGATSTASPKSISGSRRSAAARTTRRTPTPTAPPPPAAPPPAEAGASNTGAASRGTAKKEEEEEEEENETIGPVTGTPTFDPEAPGTDEEDEEDPDSGGDTGVPGEDSTGDEGAGDP